MQRLTTHLIQFFLKLLIILFVTSFIIYSTLSTTFRFLYLQKNLNKTSGQTLQAKTENPLYCGTEGVVCMLNYCFPGLNFPRIKCNTRISMWIAATSYFYGW